MANIPQTEKPYQVCLFSCPAYKPFHFAKHTWFVITTPKGTERWEVLHYKNIKNPAMTYVHKDNLPPIQGIKKSMLDPSYWDSTLLTSIDGEKNSLAHRIAQFIEQYSPQYQYKGRYVLYPGPNSNSYVAWVLEKFPEWKPALPWNAFGKKYK